MSQREDLSSFVRECETKRGVCAEKISALARVRSSGVGECVLCTACYCCFMLFGAVEETKCAIVDQAKSADKKKNLQNYTTDTKSTR